MKSFLLLFAAGASLFAQSAPSNRYIAFDSATLSAASEKLTIQQPATGAAQVKFESAFVYCSVACTATLSENGTAATTTAATPTKLTPTVAPAAANAFTASNAGAGTTIATYQLSAGQTYPIDLTSLALGSGNGTGANLSLAVSSITGSASIAIVWGEK